MEWNGGCIIIKSSFFNQFYRMEWNGIWNGMEWNGMEYGMES
jgi:hypothetical protein